MKPEIAQNYNHNLESRICNRIKNTLQCLGYYQNKTQHIYDFDAVEAKNIDYYHMKTTAHATQTLQRQMDEWKKNRQKSCGNNFSHI